MHNSDSTTRGPLIMEVHLHYFSGQECTWHKPNIPTFFLNPELFQLFLVPYKLIFILFSRTLIFTRSHLHKYKYEYIYIYIFCGGKMAFIVFAQFFLCPSLNEYDEGNWKEIHHHIFIFTFYLERRIISIKVIFDNDVFPLPRSCPLFKCHLHYLRL